MKLLMNKFFKWLNREEDSLSLSPKKEKYFNQLFSIWKIFTPDTERSSPELDHLWKELRDRIKHSEELAPSFSTKAKGIIWNRTRLTYAFAFVLIISVCIIVYHIYSAAIIYQTDKKEYASIILADSSNVKLNCSSSLEVERGFNQHSRMVTLNGEAYFSVKPEKVPFLIRTAIAMIEVVGTEFNVKSREDFVELMVNKGIVKLTSKAGKKDSTIVLHKGEYSRCSSGGFPNKPDTMTLTPYPGWLYNRLSCKNTSLLEVCREIEKQFDVSIHLADKRDESITITGVFSTRDLNTVLDAICILIKKEYNFKDGIYLIY